MKVLVFYQYFGTSKGSWSTRYYEFARRWVNAGMDVTIITSPYEKSDIQANGFISRQNIEGINLIVINVPDSNRIGVLRRAMRSLLFSIISVWYAITLKYDLIISSSGPITVGIPALAGNILRRKPFIFETRDLWPAGGIEMGKIKNPFLIQWALKFEGILYRKAKTVITCSEGQKQHIQSRYPKINIETIPHGGDLELFGDPGVTPVSTHGKFLFTHIGSLGLIHNCRLIIDAALYISKHFPDHKLRIAFIGEGAEKADLIKLAEKYHLTFVEFHELMPKEALPPWIKASRATLFTTLNNVVQNTSCPNKIFDSFAAGVPVIQTTTGWIKVLFEKEKCGINVAPDNPEMLATAMMDLSTNHKEYDEMCKNAGRLALNEFNRNNLAVMYQRILNSSAS